MVHAKRRNTERAGKAMGRRGADQQGSRQTRAFRVGHGGEFVQAAAGSFEQAAGKRQQAPDVIARGEFRHHAPIVGMQLGLRMECVSEQAAAAVIERDPGFVAGCLDAQDQHIIPSG
ncbi:hypothetical protein D3C83_02580 [compost metagenome]